MPLGNGRPESRKQVVVVEPPRESFYHFLRYGHILSSLLREFLEESFLREACRHRLTRSQFCFLKLIAANAELHVGELARSLGLSAAASSKNLDKLERLGLVNRESSPDDRRVTLLTPSPEGMQLVEEYERLKLARLKPAIEILGPWKAELLGDLLEQVCVALLDQDSKRKGHCLRCAGYYRPGCSVERLQGECALRPKRGTPGSSAGEVRA